MKVQAVTPSDAAADPSHPDHDRWVKEVTLKREVEHATRLGLPLRVAEAENQRLLEIADKKGPPPKLAKKRPRQADHNIGHAARTRARGVQRRAPRPLVAGAHLSPCGRCGTCLRCRREKRVNAMTVLARQGDLSMVATLWKLAIYASQAQSGLGQFATMSPRDANRMVIRRLEEVCDATIPLMGEWR